MKLLEFFSKTPDLGKAIAVATTAISSACVAICLQDIWVMAVPCVVAIVVWND